MVDKPLALSPSRHPFQLFILVLCFITGLPVILGKMPAPGTLENSLPDILLVGWSWVLVLGSGVAMLGSLWPGKILLEQLGLICTGFAAGLYGALVMIIAWDRGGYQAGGIILAFGAACLWRAWQIQRDINRADRILRRRRSKDS